MANEERRDSACLKLRIETLMRCAVFASLLLDAACDAPGAADIALHQDGDRLVAGIPSAPSRSRAEGLRAMRLRVPQAAAAWALPAAAICRILRSCCSSS